VNKLLALALLWGAAAPAADVTAPDDRAAALLARLAERTAAVQSFRGRATLTLAGEEAGTYAVAFGFAAPDRTRLEVTGPLGAPGPVLTASGGRLLGYDPGTRVAVVGADDHETVAAALGLDLGGSLADVAAWLAGLAPLYEGQELGVAAAEEEGEPALVTLSWRRPGAATPFQKLTLAAETAEPRLYRRFEGATCVAEITYADWRNAGGVRMPYAVTIKTDTLTAGIKAAKMDVNVALDDALFDTAPPSTAREVVTWPLEGGATDDGR